VTAEGIAALLLVALPFFAAMLGRGTIWQLLALALVAATIGSIIADSAWQIGAALWLLAWVFAGLAINRRRSEIAQERLTAASDVDDAALRRNLKRR
jgi:hypothetical protein